MNIELLYATLAKIIERREDVKVRIEVRKNENDKKTVRG
jgi:hypothetical protein